MTTSTLMPAIQQPAGEIHPASLAHLHAAVRDARQAAEEFAARSEGDAAVTLRDFAALHVEHERELVTVLARHGHSLDEGGGFSALLHKGIARLRDMFGGDDDVAAASQIDGEREVMGAYAHALMHGGDDETLALLSRQRDELAEMIQHHDPASDTVGRHP